MLQLQIKGTRRLGRELDLMRLPPGKRRTVLRSLGRKVRANARRRVREQTTVSGARMQSRSPNSPRRGKMLKGLGKRMLVQTDNTSATVKFRSGKVALKQQEGHDERITADDMRRREGEGKLSNNSPASRRQARRLRELGYKIRRGRGWKRPTLKWVTENMTMGHAGRIILVLSGETPKKSWKVGLPARPFLGVTDRERDELMGVISKACLR